MLSNEHRPEVVQLIEELDRLLEEQRVVDGRDPNALAECERKLKDLRRRIDRMTAANGLIRSHRVDR